MLLVEDFLRKKSSINIVPKTSCIKTAKSIKGIEQIPNCLIGIKTSIIITIINQFPSDPLNGYVQKVSTSLFRRPFVSFMALLTFTNE